MKITLHDELIQVLKDAEKRLTELGAREDNDLLMPRIWKVLNKTTPEYIETERKIEQMRSMLDKKDKE